jgi:hypothetical protein
MAMIEERAALMNVQMLHGGGGIRLGENARHPKERERPRPLSQGHVIESQRAGRSADGTEGAGEEAWRAADSSAGPEIQA